MKPVFLRSHDKYPVLEAPVQEFTAFQPPGATLTASSLTETRLGQNLVRGRTTLYLFASLLLSVLIYTVFQ